MMKTPSPQSGCHSIVREGHHPFSQERGGAQPRMHGDQPLLEKDPKRNMNEKKHKKILLVEDDESNRRCLRDFLEAQGYRCQEAENGADGLGKLQTEHFDLVITDLNMPIMDGFQLLEALAKHPTLERLPVMIATGQALPEVKQKTTHPRVKDVLAKPYDFPKLSQSLATLFS